MLLVQLRVVEVARGVADQTDAIHEQPGSDVAGRGEGHDLIQADPLEAVPDRGLCGLAAVALSPLGPCDTPPNLHSMERVALMDGHDADRADQSAILDPLHGPTAVAPDLDGLVVAVNGGVAAFAVERTSKPERDLGIGVDDGKRRAVGLPPRTQDQTLGLDQLSAAPGAASRP